MASFGKKTRNPGYVAGRHWLTCDVCGFVIDSREARERWDGAVVCPEDWESRHPQDFVRGREDEQYAGWPQRPDDDGYSVAPDYIFDLEDTRCTYPDNSGWAGLAVAGCAVPYPANEKYWPTDYYVTDSIYVSDTLKFNYYQSDDISVSDATLVNIYIYEGSVAGYATAGYAIAGEE